MLMTDYAVKYNISFSTDPSPIKSKSKCIFMVGSKKNMVTPGLTWFSRYCHVTRPLPELVH